MLRTKERAPKGVLITFVLLLSLHFESTSSFYCTDSFCADYTSEYMYPCPEARNCSTTGFRTFLDPDSSCNCCEYCFDYLKEGDTCEQASPRKPTEMCGPRLTCVRGERDTDPATCQTMISDPENPDNENFCMKKRHDYDLATESGTVGIAQVYPECDAEGYYAPRQCLKGSVCYCADLEGNRVFGLSLPDQYQDCACARDVARLQSFGFTGRFPHCLPNGDYDELQCVVRTCFCRSNPEELFAMHAMNESKCFDPKIHVFDPQEPRYYMRECELRRARQEVEIAEAELEGRLMIVADMPNCDPDGSYGAIQSEFNRRFCAFPENGTQIEEFEAEKYTSAAQEMNCYCARARYLLANSATGRPQCCSNGNYRPWQCIGTRCFCVDHMGRQDLLKQEVDENEVDTLECYKNAPEHCKTDLLN